jgi:hypothetical protein
VLCVDCIGCTQCFACVGLKNEEFCILNQRYSRKDYFPAVQALKKRLEEAIYAGHVLPEIAVAGRGMWPPRGSEIPKELPGEAAIAAPPVELLAAEAEVVAFVDDAVDPWADDVSPSREPGLPVERDPVVVSWVPQPSRPI